MDTSSTLLGVINGELNDVSVLSGSKNYSQNLSGSKNITTTLSALIYGFSDLNAIAIFATIEQNWDLEFSKSASLFISQFIDINGSLSFKGLEEFAIQNNIDTNIFVHIMEMVNLYCQGTIELSTYQLATLEMYYPDLLSTMYPQTMDTLGKTISVTFECIKKINVENIIDTNVALTLSVCALIRLSAHYPIVLNDLYALTMDEMTWDCSMNEVLGITEFTPTPNSEYSMELTWTNP